MHGDFSRTTFDPSNHFSSVLVQQGRVQLDADQNEQAATLLHQLRTTTADLIGPHGGPAGTGFEVTSALDGGGLLKDLEIGRGHYYVDGILCENDREEATTYLDQPDYLSPGDKLPLPLPFLVYLRVFERLVTAVEVPSIREIALGDNGPDTAARAQVVWQVRVSGTIPGTGIPVDAATDRGAVQKVWKTHRPPTGHLAARARRPGGTDREPCIISPEARYRGPENQLYRVEIHTGGDAASATFTWSRDNGSVVFPIARMQGSTTTLSTLGRDQRLGLEVGDWMEIIDDRSTRRSEPEPLARVKSIDPLDLVVELESAPAGTTGQDTGSHPFLRRWDQREPLTGNGAPTLAGDNALHVVEGDDHWIDLEDGVQIRFAPGGTYNRGDFWLIPARTGSGDVLWPMKSDVPAERPPDGVIEHLAPLALVLDDDSVVDLRCLFQPMACP